MLEKLPSRILIVDDEAAQMQVLCDALQMEGYETFGFSAPLDALEALKNSDENKFDLLLTDLSMPGLHGLSLLLSALEIDNDLVVIVMTGEGSVTTAVEAMKSGALDYIEKPFSLRTLLPVVERALTVRKLRMTNAILSQKISERTAELEAANKELESFSFSISHDLRAPLRHMSGFAKILAEDFSADLPSEAQRYIQIIEKSAHKMGRLIEDLLRFSRFGKQALNIQSIDLGRIVKDVLDDLRKESNRRDLEIKIGMMPYCMGDEALMKQVMINLLSNAFKFTSKKPKAIIEIGYSKESDAGVYFIRDNGAGFSMEHADKLFSVFQRLHGSDEFEGTGAGLSIVQRIIVRHGGRIWAQSVVDEGATFYFTLPKSH